MTDKKPEGHFTSVEATRAAARPAGMSIAGENQPAGEMPREAAPARVEEKPAITGDEGQGRAYSAPSSFQHSSEPGGQGRYDAGEIHVEDNRPGGE